MFHEFERMGQSIILHTNSQNRLYADIVREIVCPNAKCKCVVFGGGIRKHRKGNLYFLVFIKQSGDA